MRITVKTDFLGDGFQRQIGILDQKACPVHPYFQQIAVQVGAGVRKK